MLVPPGQPGPGPHSAPTWFGFNEQDGDTARRAQDRANQWVKDPKCDHALQRYGLSSVGDALNKIHFKGSDQHVWNGRTSEYVTNFLNSKGQTVTLQVKQFFAENRTTVGAIVTKIQWGPQMFLGDAFFNPGIAGVQNVYFQDAQALIMMHEAVHLAGLGDAVFGGSKQLMNILIDNCYPIIKTHLGGLTQ